jgi:EthD domain
VAGVIARTVTTVALLERRGDISRDLFRRYWRDVHGVMAARIPGFDCYTQYHVTPVQTGIEPFEGIAIVTYLSEADRAGLIHSEVTQHIHRDEQNVFRRALLYNLGEGADRVLEGSAVADGQSMFVVCGDGDDTSAILALLQKTSMYLATYDLTVDDPANWNETDTAGRTFALLVHGIWPDRASAAAVAANLPAATYLADESYIMVEAGHPTPVGLRGLDAVKTIQEAKADNQLSPDVVRAIYGAIASP